MRTPRCVLQHRHSTRALDRMGGYRPANITANILLEGRTHEQAYAPRGSSPHQYLLGSAWLP